MSVRERVVLVTGASQGIGLAIARDLGARGARVALVARQADKIAAAAREIGGGAVALECNVQDPAAANAAVQRVVDELGALHGVVNNAGITRDGTLLKMSYEAWKEVIDTNLGGCFNMAKATFAGMKDRGWGRIVNIGSINGQAGQYGQVNYAAAKSGIHGFTKALAQEGAKFGVTVNAIAPGYIDTDMVAAVPADVLAKIVAKIPVGRLGQASEIARGVAFLCSEEGGFITGSTMSINGGQHMY